MPNQTSPSRIQIIRHGEKPEADFLGVTFWGKHSEYSLIVKGWQRAGGLACLFSGGNTTGPLSAPELLVCPSYDDKETHRVFETIWPLALRLGLPIEQLGHVTKPKPAMDRVFTAGVSTALICWEHQNIPDLAKFIKITGTQPPEHWPDSRFDLIWVFDTDPAHPGSYTFTELRQNLLGDGSTPPLR